MEKIASFTVNHLDLIPGVYVSRKDYVGKEVLTTFDLRMCAPNREPVMNTAELHTIEHLAATYLRNEPDWKEKIIYFGPMGCRTGCYLILAGDYESKDVVSLVRDTFRFIAEYDGEIPGAAPKDCGNYLTRICRWQDSLPENIWPRRWRTRLNKIWCIRNNSLSGTPAFGMAHPHNFFMQHPESCIIFFFFHILLPEPHAAKTATQLKQSF